MSPATNKNSINLVVAADDRYAMPLAVAVRSALERMHGGMPRVFVLDDGISASNRDRVLASWSGLLVQPEWIPLGDTHISQLNMLPVSSIKEMQYISRCTFARLMLGELLPHDVSRVIFLDCDILVRADLGDLWAIGQDGKVALAVQDYYIHTLGHPAISDSMPDGMPSASPYFNTGVLVIDVELWRRHRIGACCIEYLEQYKERNRFMDQNALNVALYGKWKAIDHRWNQQQFIHRASLQHLPMSRQQFTAAKNHPYIIHFTTGDKPWLAACRHPDRQLFFQQLDKTAWSGWRPPQDTGSVMSFEDTINNAIAFQQNDQMDKALELYRSAEKKSPNNPIVLSLLSNIAQCHVNLANTLMRMGIFSQAIQSLQHALSIVPNIPDVHLELGKLFIRTDNVQQATAHFRHYLRLVPEDKAGAIMLLAYLGQEKIPSAHPKGFVKNYYDNFATVYDEYLVTRLDYKCPRIIADELQKYQINHVDILDLGCGTGLCGLALKHLANSLDGVDLSRQMLNVAQQRNIYDTLEENDIFEFMRTRKTLYDVVVAGGLLEYISDPHSLFSAVVAVLRESGMFIFTAIENPGGEGLGVNASGLYTHGSAYLETLAIQCGLTPVSITGMAMWYENGQPVSGRLIVLKKRK
jgi:predicted TPR repeat methyltransferase